MSISIPPSSTGAITSLSGGAQRGITPAIAAPLNGLSERIVGRIVGEFGLGQAQPKLGHDPYRLTETAEALGDAVGATPQQRGEIARALTQLVQSATARLSARPVAASVEAIRDALSAVSGNSPQTLIASLSAQSQEI